MYFLCKSAIEKIISPHLFLMCINISTSDSEDFFPNQEKVDICHQVVNLLSFHLLPSSLI